MKIDRLLGITLYLLNRETVSASALAERFEVSKRTIQRDMDALSLAGIPVVSTFGAEGGYRIEDGFRLTKQIAGAQDYGHIITALKGLQSAYGTQKVGATLEKALSAMPTGDPHVFVDFGVAREGAHVQTDLQALESAIARKTPLRILYSDAEGIPSERIVEPLALTYRWYAWYLFAYCTSRQDYRLFKLPRILRHAPVKGAFSRVHGPAEALMRARATADTRRLFSIRLLCKRESRPQVMEYLKGEIVETRENGDFVLAMRLPFERMWFSLLMGFGSQVQVLGPADLRAMLRERAEEILALYPRNDDRQLSPLP